MTAGKSSASAQATAPASPNQVFLPASLFGLAAGIVISNNIFILKALACDFYFLYAEHRSPHSPQECAAEPKVEQLMGGLTTIHAVVTALLGIVGIRIMRPVLVRGGRKWGWVAVGLCGGIFCTCIAASKLVIGLAKLFMIVGGFLVGALFSETLAAMAGENMILDTTSESSRAAYYTVFQGFLRGSAAVGTTVGGFAAGYFASDVVPYWFAGGVFGLLALWSVFKRDSLSQERRQELLNDQAPKQLDTPASEVPPDTSDEIRHDMRRCFRTSEVLQPLTLFLPTRNESGRRSWALAFAATGLILLMLGVTCQTPLLLLFMSNQLKYQQEETGVALSALLGSTAVYLLVVFPSASTWLKKVTSRSKKMSAGMRPSEYTPLLTDDGAPPHPKIEHSHAFDLAVSIVSILIYAVAFLLLAVTRNTAMFSIAIGLLVLSSGAQPNLTAYMASLVKPSETDTLNAAVSILQNLMAVVSPVVFLGLYSFTVKKAPAITFLVLAGLMLLSALLLMFKIQRPF